MAETKACLESELADLLAEEAELQLEIEAQRELFGDCADDRAHSPRKKGRRKKENVTGEGQTSAIAP
jgi:hypothetical protein